jgi:tRNA pseudouridine55 synthase
VDRAPDGLILIDKRAGITSHDVVDEVRRALGNRKVGHAGTLDPMATGLLVVGVGRATRLLRYFGELRKTYEGTGRLGEETDTLDAEGTIVRTSRVSVSRAELDLAAAGLVGASMQVPPAYSAVKVGGRKLYDAARAGEVLEAPPRPIRVDAFDVRAFAEPDFDFILTCSGGTYVRRLVADLGGSLDCGAHLVRLRRTAIGPYHVEDAEPGPWIVPGAVVPLDRAVGHLPRVDLTPEEAEAAGYGRILGPAGIEGPYGVYGPQDRLIGIYRDDGAKARPEVILVPVGG